MPLQLLSPPPLMMPFIAFDVIDELFISYLLFFKIGADAGFLSFIPFKASKVLIEGGISGVAVVAGVARKSVPTINVSL